MHRSGRRGGRRTVWPCAPCTGRCLDRMAPVKRRTAHQQDYFRVTWRADRTARHGSNRDRDPVRGALPLLLLPACLARSVVSYCPSPYPSRSPPARPPLPPVLPTNPSMVYPGRDHSLHCLGSQRVRTRSHGSIRPSCAIHVHPSRVAHILAVVGRGSLGHEEGDGDGAQHGGGRHERERAQQLQRRGLYAINT